MGVTTLTSQGNLRFQVRLEPLLRSGLQARATTRNVSMNELVVSVLEAYVKASAEEAGGTPILLRHLDMLIATLEAQANQLALKQAEAAGPGPFRHPMKADKDTQADRVGLHDTVNSILKTVIKLCESEEAAKNAKARMEAMRVANTTVRTDLALLQGFDRRDIQVLIDEVKATNESLKAKLGAAEKSPKRN
jgi:hypothetical protein